MNGKLTSYQHDVGKNIQGQGKRLNAHVFSALTDMESKWITFLFFIIEEYPDKEETTSSFMLASVSFTHMEAEQDIRRI